ncbi:HD domain-containing protein [bacterium]|nr:HD domain-containing protein [bacterium]
MNVDANRLVNSERVRAFRQTLEKNGFPNELSNRDSKGAMKIDLPENMAVYFSCQGVPEQIVPIILTSLTHLLASEYELVDLTRELSNTYEEISLLYELSNAFSGTLQLDKIQKTAIDEISKTLDVQMVSILMLNEDKTGLILASGLGVNENHIGKVRFQKGEGLAWSVIQKGQSLIANDLFQNGQYMPGEKSERSLLLSPIATKFEIIGVLAVSDKLDRSDFSSKDEKLLTTIAQQMGAVLENAQLYREAHELFINTVEALAAAIDAKDPYTFGHSERVTAFSMVIARELKLAFDEIERIRITALLHDIGKLGVSEQILRKPGKLTKEEYGEIQKHPVIGASIMNHVRKLSRFIPGMIDHHERFDGSGYPDGQKGASISLAGRIIAIADTFDAITSNRPYHPDQKGRPPEVALAEIIRCSGTHFDPSLVEVFTKAYEKGSI